MKSMKSFKCILAIVLILTLACVVLVACNGKSVTLSFETNGGASVGAITAKGGASVTLPEPDPSEKRENGVTYVFDGWSLNSDLSGDLYRGTVTAPKGDSTYYAVWTRGYRVTLNAMSGSINTPFIYLKEGASVYDAVKDIAPTAGTGLTYSGWYLGEEAVDETTLMPANDITLTAKYSVGYIVAYYLQDYDGNYAENENYRQTSSGLVGDVASGSRIDIPGYKYNVDRSKNTVVITLGEDPAKNTVIYYYDIDGLHVTYHANPPAGTVAYGEMAEQIADHGANVKAKANEFTLEGFRFLGWADFEGSKVVKYEVDEVLDFAGEDTLDLYAVWQQGLVDAIGGSDYLFLDRDFNAEDKSGKKYDVYLVRSGVEEKTGEVDPATGAFTFKDGDRVILSGVLDVETNSFYYYNHTFYKEFDASDGSCTVEISENYSATYKSGETSKQGKVTFDAEWGYYVFTSNDFDNDKFMFRFVFEENEDGETVMALQNMDEAGYYATVNGYPVIYLDGLGNFEYYFDPDHPTYYDITNEPVLVTNGIYHVNSNGYYECSMYAGDTSNENNHLEDFIFRILQDEGPKTKPSGSNLPQSYELKEQAIERSTLYGQLSKELFLDGFGGGVYTEFANEQDEVGVSHEGTYQVLHNFWMTTDARDSMQVWFINFTYEGADKDIYFDITQDRRGVVSALYFGSVAPKGGVGGVATFEKGVTLGGVDYIDAFIMFLLDANNETMVFVNIDDGELGSGDSVTIYAPMYTGTVTKTATTDVYHFESVSHDAQMNFKLLENGKAEYVPGAGEGSLDKREIDKDLIVDPVSGTATYKDDQGNVYNDVRYTYSGSQFIEFYSFKLDDDRNLYYYRDVHNDSKEFVKISGDMLLDYSYITEDVMFAYPARLLLTANGRDAFIALPMAIGEPTYVGYGTYAQVSDNEYTFNATSWLREDSLLEFFGGDGYQQSLNEFHSYYDSFTFRKEGGDENNVGEFYARFDDMFFELDNFKADGYSNKATYITDGGYEIEGTFYRMEIIIVFEMYDSNADENSEPIASYYLKEDTATNRVKNVSEDAGLYYFYDIDSVQFETFGPDYGGSLTDYFVYDGDGGVTVVDIQEDFLANPHAGTMVPSDKWTEDFREYVINEEDTGKVYRVLLGTHVALYGDVYLVYDIYNEAYDGEWFTDEYGTLHGNGYRMQSATYDADGDGEVDYTGLMVRAKFDKTDIQTHGYEVDENGDVIVFTYRIDVETSASIVFDIAKGENGFEYLIERKLIFGSFAYWSVGERPGNYLYLDGKGNAELYNESDELVGSGTYGLDPDKGETSYFYKDKNNIQNFSFAIYIESEEGGSTYFEYRVYTENTEGEYDAEDWSHISVNGYGEIVYTDRYGVVYEGYYRVSGTEITLITYDGSGITFTFRFVYSTGAFEFVSQGKIE